MEKQEYINFFVYFNDYTKKFSIDSKEVQMTNMHEAFKSRYLYFLQLEYDIFIKNNLKVEELLSLLEGLTNRVEELKNYKPIFNNQIYPSPLNVRHFRLYKLQYEKAKIILLNLRTNDSIMEKKRKIIKIGNYLKMVKKIKVFEIKIHIKVLEYLQRIVDPKSIFYNPEFKNVFQLLLDLMLIQNDLNDENYLFEIKKRTDKLIEGQK